MGLKRFFVLISLFLNTFLLKDLFVLGSSSIQTQNFDLEHIVFTKSLKDDVVSEINQLYLNTIKLDDLRMDQKSTLMYFQYVDKQDYEFYKERVPEEYLLTFLYATRDDKDLRKLVYSLMVHETINFSEYVNTNKNKTVDHGPMMLNSANLQNKHFMNVYSPKDIDLQRLGIDLNSIKKDQVLKYNYYILICVNLLKGHLKRYESRKDINPLHYALRAYNGGEISNTIHASETKLRKTNWYSMKVRKIFNKTKKEYQLFQEQYAMI